MGDIKPKRSFFESFRFSDRESCARAIKNGGIAALISAGLTGLLAAIGLFNTPSDKTLAFIVDPSGLIDAAMVAVLGLFVFRKSRIASTLLVAYFVTAKMLMWVDLGKPNGWLPMTIIFFLYYVTAMRATFRWNKLYRSPFTETPNGAALKTEAVTPQQAGMEHKGPAERNSSGIGISAPSSDEEVWAYALKEYESTNRNAGLYAKLFAEFEGDEGKTKAAYLKAAYLKARGAQLATEANRRRAAVITHEGDAWG
jgi:hypothetical protein